MHRLQVVRELKRDALGRVELLQRDQELFVRRVACGGRIPGSGLAARLLLARERRALGVLEGLPGVPVLVEDPELAAAPGADGARPAARDVLVRTWIAGEPLHRAARLHEDFFDHADRLVAAAHERGVCHNDLHKEQNLVVGADGYPALIDFQLASCHAPGVGRGRRFCARTAEDFRHLQKHRRRYTRDGRGPASQLTGGTGHGLRRAPLSTFWRRFVKPVYIRVTRDLLRTRDGEERRSSSGPWPEWGPPMGPRPGLISSLPRQGQRSAQLHEVRE